MATQLKSLDKKDSEDDQIPKSIPQSLPPQAFPKPMEKMDKPPIMPPSSPSSMRRARSDDVSRLMHYPPVDYVVPPQTTDLALDSLFFDQQPMPPIMRTRTVPNNYVGGYDPTYPPPMHGYEEDLYAIEYKRRTEADYLARELANTMKVVNDMEQDEDGLTRELSRLTMQHQASLSKVKDLEKKFDQSRVTNAQVKSELKMQKEAWEKEREELLHQARRGGELPPEIQEHENLKAEIEQARKRNDVLKAMIDITDQNLQRELQIIQQQLQSERDITKRTEEHNSELDRRLTELKKQKETLEKELKEEKEKETLGDPKIPENGLTKVYLEYPPESTVIQNLLQAQVEFYFSDYNLKRDKRLLEQVCQARKGFLKLDEVMKLSRIRQLCSEKEQLVEALKRSKILTLDLDEALVGRPNFEKPREKEFPFRRTVFIFGVPRDEGEEFLKEMLEPFGNVSKIQFDHGPDTLDRRIGQKFLNKPRVYQLFSSQGHASMTFRTQHHIHKEITMIHCSKCNKNKPGEEGFYEAHGWSELICAQCAAQLAEDQMNLFFNSGKFEGADKFFLGEPPRDINKRKTALVVFASQRQASKCAYVRSRVGYRGAFATHFHHYSKVKKEIALSEQSIHDISHRRPLYRSNSHFSGNRRFNNSRIRNPRQQETHPPPLVRTITAPVLGVNGRAHIQSHPRRSLRPPRNSTMRFAKPSPPAWTANDEVLL